MGVKAEILRLQEENKLKVLSLSDGRCSYICPECGASRDLALESIGNNLKAGRGFHTEFCMKYWNDLIREELGEKKLQVYRAFYRHAHERCCNPKCKDYVRYKGKFHFKDFSHFFRETYSLYKESLLEYENEALSIDRIDNNKGYEPGNVRFVPMRIQSLNRRALVPTTAVNIETGETFSAPSCRQLAREHFNSCYTSIREALVRRTPYKQVWKIIPTSLLSVSTIEKGEEKPEVEYADLK